MASLAGLLSEDGYAVAGADEALYPPMKGLVEELGIPVHEGYGPECLAGDIDLVVVGNVVTRRFPAAAELSRRRLPYVSLPQALSGLFLAGTSNLVVAGCHGKTTLTALCATLLEAGGLRPGFLIGGAALGFPRPFRKGAGGFFVIEGDEYDCAFFDKRPKFVHYRPRVAVLTSVEYDHADIYPDLESVSAAYRTLAGLIPPDGLLVANGDEPLCREAAASCRGRVSFYGEGEGCPWRLAGFRAEGFRSDLEIRGPEGRSFRLSWPRLGRYNALGACAAVAAALELGADPESFPAAFSSFRGVRRRQEPVFDSYPAFLGKGSKGRAGPLRERPGRAPREARAGTRPEGAPGGSPEGPPGAEPPEGVTVVDDFAHHPTAVSATLSALKEAFPDRRLLAAFEPRSNTSRRGVFQESYALAFGAADRVYLCGVDRPEKAPEGDRLDVGRLREAIGPSKALSLPGPDAVYGEIVREAGPGDLICVMSNGSFGNLAARLAGFFGAAASAGLPAAPDGV
jgi:UDP-N-acetylmuramate: L-alanyl-gamma-D-glutamyl-meso-diaminopimelate ligase